MSRVFPPGTARFLFVRDMTNGGEIDIRKTHPNLYWLVMTLAVGALALGANFIFYQPTFLIFDRPNELWGAIFLVLGVAEIVFLNLYRRLRFVRWCIAFSMAYTMFLAWGTSEPFRDGVGSLQLPILYAVVAALQIPLMFEPFINPWTSRR